MALPTHEFSVPWLRQRVVWAGHGLMWLPGMGTKTIPFYAPNWWDRDAEWVARVKKNPLG